MTDFGTVQRYCAQHYVYDDCYKEHAGRVTAVDLRGLPAGNKEPVVDEEVVLQGLRDRMGDLDDMLAYEMEHMPRQASADLIPWTERVRALKMEWDIVRAILGERVR
jgi:hypothetical protein